MNQVHQVFEDCPNCRVEAAVTGLVDPMASEHRHLESLCRLCGRRELRGELVSSGERFTDLGSAQAALEAWARREGYEDVRSFCRANLGELTETEVSRKLLAGEPVESNFEVIAYLFPSLAGERRAPSIGVVSNTVSGERGSTSVSVGTNANQSVRTLVEQPVHGDSEKFPGSETPVWARALATVMLADSRLRLSELRFVAGILESNGRPPLTDTDMRPWRPADLPRPEDPERVVLSMMELVDLDGHRGDAEWRVVREFARHWNVTSGELSQEPWVAGGRRPNHLAVLWRGFRSLFVWEE